MDKLSLPTDAIKNILSFLSYDEISKNRIVSTSFNKICMGMLNQGFLKIERRHAQALKNVKAQMPRQKSERRSHQLSRHWDILTSIKCRISMLNKTYTQFIENELCCFIPGKVIDEIGRVLTIVETEETLPPAHEVLQELRDLSSMAIEHCDDELSPDFRGKLREIRLFQGELQRHPDDVELASLGLRRSLKRLRESEEGNLKATFALKSQLALLGQQLLVCKRTTMNQRTVIDNMTKRQKAQTGEIARANIQPRKPTRKLPSLSEADEKPPTETPTLDDSLHFPHQHSKN